MPAFFIALDRSRAICPGSVCVFTTSERCIPRSLHQTGSLGLLGCSSEVTDVSVKVARLVCLNFRQQSDMHNSDEKYVIVLYFVRLTDAFICLFWIIVFHI